MSSKPVPTSTNASPRPSPGVGRIFQRELKNFFIFKFPKFFVYPPEPQIPDYRADPTAWRAFIQSNLSSSFIPDKTLQGYTLPADGTLAEDVETLNQLLVGVYLTEDHRAKYHQNDFLRFQWSFTFLAFFSTMVATLTVVYSTLSPLFSIITTILGGFVTLFVYAYNRERPQRRWYERRRSAEALRRHYYQYLVHLAPYHTANHRYVLQLMVDRIRKNSSDPLPVQPDAKPRKSHTRREIDAIYDIYLKQRVAGQKNYYKYKADECDFNSDLTFLMGGLLPFAATVVSAWTMFNTSQSLSALVIILPALAAIFISFQRIYDWDRQFSIFIRTYEGLQTAEIVDETIDDKRALLLELVGRVESILASEADQWGQALVERDAELSAEQVLNEFIKKTGLKDKNRIAEIRGMLDLPDDDEEDKDKDGIPDRKPSRPNAEG